MQYYAYERSVQGEMGYGDGKVESKTWNIGKTTKMRSDAGI